MFRGEVPERLSSTGCGENLGKIESLGMAPTFGETSSASCTSEIQCTMLLGYWAGLNLGIRSSPLQRCRHLEKAVYGSATLGLATCMSVPVLPIQMSFCSVRMMAAIRLQGLYLSLGKARRTTGAPSKGPIAAAPSRWEPWAALSAPSIQWCGTPATWLPNDNRVI